MSPLSTYHSLLLSNLSAVQTVESALSNVTWLLPGRFDDAEVASEGLYALLNLVSGYHDTILSSHLDRRLSLPPHPFAPSSSPQPASHVAQVQAGSSSTPASTSSSSARILPLLPPRSEHNRYTSYWTSKSPTYRRAARALSTLSYMELLIEMVLRRKAGDRARWRVVLLIEGLKTVLRLVILRITRRPILHHPTPQREIDPSSLPPEVLTPSATSSSSDTDSPATLTQSLPPYAPLRFHLYPMVDNLPEEYLPHPTTLIPQLQGLSAYASEIISSSIGLVHVLLLIRAARQTDSRYRPSSLPTLSRSLPPFLIPLLLALIAKRLRPSSGSSTLLASHYAQQDRRLAARYFLTGPMWIGWTRPKVLSIIKGVEKIPLVGLAGELVEGYLPLVDDYFYYTSS